MKLFTPFSQRMDRLSENQHAQKCAWIFFCAVFAATIAGCVGLLISKPASIWAMAVVGSGVGAVMFRNYGRLWELSGPNLGSKKTQPLAVHPYSAIHTTQPSMSAK